MNREGDVQPQESEQVCVVGVVVLSSKTVIYGKYVSGTQGKLK